MNPSCIGTDFLPESAASWMCRIGNSGPDFASPPLSAHQLDSNPVEHCLALLDEGKSAPSGMREDRDALRGFLQVLHTKVPFLVPHSIRACSLALAFGVELGLDRRMLRALRWGGLLHDIGKLCVSNDVLIKRGALTPTEWRLMRCHPEIGGSILSAVSVDPLAIEVATQHHERFDGTGYPNGLKGDQISLLARLFAVADCFDAMLSARPYSRARHPEIAGAEIGTWAGSQFDPLMVSLFLSVPVSEWLSRAYSLAYGRSEVSWLRSSVAAQPVPKRKVSSVPKVNVLDQLLLAGVRRSLACG